MLSTIVGLFTDIGALNYIKETYLETDYIS